MGNCQNVISDKDTEQEVETTLKQDVAQNMGPQSQQAGETKFEPKPSNEQKTNEHNALQGQEQQETKGSKDAPSSHNHNKTIKIKQRGSALIIKDKKQEKGNYVKEALDKMPLEFQVKFQEKLEEYGMTGITTKEEYDQVLERIVMERFQPAHRRPPKKDETDMIPKVSTVEEVIDEMLTKSHIVVLTGAGLSVASNLPTFRGEGGYWTLRDKQTKLKAIDFLTHHYFKKSPEEIWRWHHEFRRLASQNGPNASHHAIADFQVFCKEFKKKFSLITQNIDGYHIEAYVKAAAKQKLITLQPNGPKVPKELMTKFGLFDDIYEIHGSVEYMRCDNECKIDLYASPQVGCDIDFVDKCPNCGGIARPHTLFFDESYDDNYYRARAVIQELDTMDCLVVIGTALETSLAVGIVERARQQNNLIIEINPDPCIKNGNVRHLIGGAEKFVPDLFKGLEKKTLDNIGPKKKLQL